MLSETDARWMLDMLEALAAKLGIRVRVEAVGTREDERMFQGGTCLFKGERLIVVDSRLSVQQQCRALAAELKKVDLSQVFVHPRVRFYLEDDSV